MHSNQSNEIHKMQQQIDYLHQYIQHLNDYISHLNVYEYYIQGVKIEKVKGTFQLGHLMEQEVNESDGIHRFYIGEIRIREIEDSGTVGLGATQKGGTKRTIPPEEATEEIEEIFENIKTLLVVEDVPTFFQSLAIHKDVLKKVWVTMKDNWDSSHDFALFYEKVLMLLNDAINPEIGLSDPQLEPDSYITLADSIEEQAKTLLVISYLLELSLPGYFKKYRLETPKIDSSHQPNIQVSVQQIMIAIKDTFYLKGLPSSFDELGEHPNTLRYLFFNVIQPIVEKEDATDYFLEMQDLFQKQALHISENIDPKELSPDEQGFLFSVLIEHLDRYQKYILLEYILLQI